MFAMIDVSKATHLAIYIPAARAADFLPSLSNMLENNTHFIQKAYSEIEVLEPGKMEILLGNKLVIDNDYGDGNKVAFIAPGMEVMEGWVPCESAQVFVDFRKVKEKHAEEKKKLQTEIDYLKSKISELQAAAVETTPDDFDF